MDLNRSFLVRVPRFLVSLFHCVVMERLLTDNSKATIHQFIWAFSNVMALSHSAGSTLRTRNECYSSMFVLCPLLSANYVSDKKAMLVVNTFLWGVNFHRPYNINSNNLSRRITPTIMLLALRHRRCSNLEKVYTSPCPPGHRGSIVSRSVTYRHTCF